MISLALGLGDAAGDGEHHARRPPARFAAFSSRSRPSSEKTFSAAFSRIWQVLRMTRSASSGAVGRGIAERRQHIGHALAVIDVHLAAPGLDEQALPGGIWLVMPGKNSAAPAANRRRVKRGRCARRGPGSSARWARGPRTGGGRQRVANRLTPEASATGGLPVKQRFAAGAGRRAGSGTAGRFCRSCAAPARTIRSRLGASALRLGRRSGAKGSCSTTVTRAPLRRASRQKWLAISMSPYQANSGRSRRQAGSPPSRS